MQLSGFLRLIENVGESPPEAVKTAMQLSQMPRWDSLAVMEFVAALGRQLGIRVQVSALTACKTVDDLVTQAGPRGGTMTLRGNIRTALP